MRSRLASISPEFQLLAACCRWPTDRALVSAKAAAKPDWTHFVQLVDRHRVRGLASYSLRNANVSLPAAQTQLLSESARAAAVTSLRLASEATRLDQLLRGRGVQPRFIKGSPLAMLAYGSLGLKEACDIDILINWDDVVEAFNVLKENGYIPLIDDREVPEEKLIEWSKISKDTLWHHFSSNITVELHTRLFSNPLLVPELSSSSPIAVAIGSGKSLSTLPLQELSLYLCVHGALHAWSRLKWLADFSALYIRLDSVEREELFVKARLLRIERPLVQAVTLSCLLFNIECPTRIQREFKASKRIQSLTRVALSAMTSGGEQELDDRALGTLEIQLAHFFVAPGLKHKYSELQTKLSHPSDLNASRLRTRFSFLDPLTAVPRWLWRRWRMSHRAP